MSTRWAWRRAGRDGRVTAGSRPSGFPYEDLPHGIDTELLVETGGLLQGRFLMALGPETRSTLEQRLKAVAFADQVGAALATASRLTASRKRHVFMAGDPQTPPDAQGAAPDKPRMSLGLPAWTPFGFVSPPYRVLPGTAVGREQPASCR